MSTYIHIEDPQLVLDEVEYTLGLVFPQYDYTELEAVYQDVVNLFGGRYRGYQACNTQYHNLKHTTDVVLAMGRLLHGAKVAGQPLEEDIFSLGLIAALMHDVGFIQTEDDRTGTGAKYTATHVDRSITFMQTYLAKRDYEPSTIESCACIIKSTCLDTDFAGIRFPAGQVALAGKLLATADLLGQMADRAYLEKLLFLYYEFREGNVGGYQKELDILQKSLAFYKTTKKRLASELGNVNTYMRPHFKKRWNIDRDFYEESIQRNIDYLNGILSNHRGHYRDYLRRDGIIDQLPQGEEGKKREP